MTNRFTSWDASNVEEVVNGTRYTAKIGKEGNKSQNGQNGRTNLWNPYFMETYEVNYVPGTMRVHSHGSGDAAVYRNVPTGAGVAEPMPQLAWTTDDIFALYSRMASKLRGTQFNAAVTAAEGHRSFSTIADGARSLGTAFAYAKGGKFGRAASALGLSPGRQRSARAAWVMPKDQARRPTRTELADNWLALQYGWKPIINDVNNAAKALSDYVDGKQFRQRYSVRVSKRQNDAWATVYPTGSNGYQQRDESLSGVAICYVYENQLRTAWTGFDNWSSVAWELVPYSFVADWFLDIGSYLESISVLSTAAAAGGQAFLTTLRRKQTRAYLFPGKHRYDVIRGANTTLRQIRLVRSAFPLTGMPPPQVKPMSEALSVQRALTALAFGARTFR